MLATCEQKSNLEQYDTKADQPPVPSPSENPTPSAPSESTAPETKSPWPVDDLGIPVPQFDGHAPLISGGSDANRTTLRLALADDTRYRITTIGMLFLPLIEKPTGFAREEEVQLTDCDGSELTRSCRIVHTHNNFEGEPPTGAGLEAEERQVSALTTTHRLDATGLRLGATEVEGPAELRDAPPGQALAHAHRMFCLRLPSEAVGEGATWKDVCSMRQTGALVTREVTWKLEKLEDSPDGKRAQLRYAGKVWTKDKQGMRTGRIEGSLLFWVDAGEPHLLRERIAFVIDSSKGLETATDFRYQFTKVGSDGETLLRTDGKPFAQPPVLLNDTRGAPSGSTRDGELPPQSTQPKRRP